MTKEEFEAKWSPERAKAAIDNEERGEYLTDAFRLSYEGNAISHRLELVKKLTGLSDEGAVGILVLDAIWGTQKYVGQVSGWLGKIYASQAELLEKQEAIMDHILKDIKDEDGWKEE